MNIHYSDDKSKLVINHRAIKHSAVLISAVVVVYTVMALLSMAQSTIDHVTDIKSARHAALK